MHLAFSVIELKHVAINSHSSPFFKGFNHVAFVPLTSLSQVTLMPFQCPTHGDFTTKRKQRQGLISKQNSNSAHALRRFVAPEQLR